MTAIGASGPTEPAERVRPLIRVGLVAFPECSPSVLFGVFDTLWTVGRLGGKLGAPLFEPRIVGAELAPLQLYNGVSILPQDSVDAVDGVDIVFVPHVKIETAEHLHALDRRLIHWIADMHAAGAQLYAVCAGSLVLAEAGLLGGLEATTHWRSAPLFRSMFPDIPLHVDRALVQAGPGHGAVCSGGAAAWQDLVLMLIAKNAGTEEAIRISKLFMYQWHREGQLPYTAMVVNADHGDLAILRCQEWLGDNYAQADVVCAAAEVCGLPKRSFDRRFRAATGYSPLAYVQALRVEEAKQMLETTTLPIEAIGREVGYEDAASFRTLFRRLVRMPPGEYRRKLQLPEQVKHVALPARSAASGAEAARA